MSKLPQIKVIGDKRNDQMKNMPFHSKLEFLEKKGLPKLFMFNN